jgi:hypothetical protein
MKMAAARPSPNSSMARSLPPKTKDRKTVTMMAAAAVMTRAVAADHLDPDPSVPHTVVGSGAQQHGAALAAFLHQPERASHARPHLPVRLGRQVVTAQPMTPDPVLRTLLTRRIYRANPNAFLDFNFGWWRAPFLVCDFPMSPKTLSGKGYGR